MPILRNLTAPITATVLFIIFKAAALVFVNAPAYCTIASAGVLIVLIAFEVTIGHVNRDRVETRGIVMVTIAYCLSEFALSSVGSLPPAATAAILTLAAAFVGLFNVGAVLTLQPSTRGLWTHPFIAWLFLDAALRAESNGDPGIWLMLGSIAAFAIWFVVRRYGKHLQFFVPT